MNNSFSILEHHPLDSLNTLGLRANARYFVSVSSVDALRQALAFAKEKQLDVVPLGGGSNVVLNDPVNALVIAVNLQGREVVSQNDRHIRVQAGAGENWHEFVLWTLAQNACGLENLSLIPGNVGAAPIQNIGAYGVEIKDFFTALEAIDVTTGEQKVFSAQDCAFGYRDSVFKGKLRDQYIITSVTFDLDCQLTPRLKYGHLQRLLDERLNGAEPTATDISQAVCDIRQQKLPDPKDLGNAGSFFKNPVVRAAKLDSLRQDYPEVVAYPAGEQWKLAAGWLIDKAGLRGIREGDLGTYQQQALVLVNHGRATGKDVVEFSAMIQNRVMAKFGVELEREPRIY